MCYLNSGGERWYLMSNTLFHSGKVELHLQAFTTVSFFSNNNSPQAKIRFRLNKLNYAYY